MARGREHVRARLISGKAVKKNVTGPIGHGKEQALARMRREIGDLGIEQHRDRLQFSAPPRVAGTKRRQFEGTDGRRHGEAVFTIGTQ